jgi:hypothetical protein
MKTNATYPKVIIHRLGGPAVTRPAHFSGIRWLFLAALLFVAATSASLANPFTVRTLPAGFDKVIDRGGSAGPVMHPIAADFMGNGSLQWYQGGNVISGFPGGGNLTLTSMTLPSSPAATVAPLTAVVCDVDRDGDMDIVRINQWNGSLYEFTLQVFLNSGVGTFTLGSRLDWTDNPSWNEGEHYYSIVPADFNKDGSTDLAVLATYQNTNQAPATNTELGQLFIRWNDGTGGFASYTVIQPTGLSAQCRISVADYDRDGDPDLYCNLYTTYGPDKPIGASDVFRRSLLFTNDGTGAMANGANFSNLRPGRLLDFNGDGWADLVGDMFPLSPDQTLALNDGTGSFGALTNPSSSLAPGVFVPLGDMSVFADFANGVRPSVVSAEAGGMVRVNDNGATGLDVGSVEADLPAEVTGITAADSDADGDTDIFVSLANGTFAFLEDRKLHSIPRATLSFRMGFSGITALHSADFNLDGREDVLVVTPTQKKLWMLYTQTNGNPDTAVFKSTQSETPGGVAVADFDQDGRPDVAYTLPAIGSVRLARNNGNIPAIWLDTAIATGLTGVSMIATGEYGTPNGRPDLFTGSGTTGQIRGLYQSGATWVGQTIVSSLSPVPQALAVGQISITPGDEVAYLSAGPSSLTLRGSQLSAGWTALGLNGISETVTGGQHAVKVIWADTSGDSRNKEAIYINGSGGLSAWYPNLLASYILGSAPTPIRDIAAVDWDHDGRTDVLAATDTGLCLFHYRRVTSNWTRTDLYSHTDGGGYTALTIIDLNQDGYPDVVAAHSAGYLDYILNTHHKAAADFSAVPTEVNGPAGQTITVMEFPITNAARPAESGGLEDVALALGEMTVEFQAASPGPNGTWVPSQISSGTLSNYVSKVKYSVNGVPMATTTIVGGANHSFITLNNGVVPPLSTPGAPMQVRVDLEMAPAAQQSTTRLFVGFSGSTSLSLSLYDKSNYQVAGSVSDTLMISHDPVLVTYVPPPTALQQWRTTHFGSPNESGNTANSADYDLDGVPNLVEYITGTTPTVRESVTNGLRGLTVIAPAGPQLPAKLGLVMTNSALANPKVRVTIERSTNLTSWSSYATRTGGGAWSGNALQVSSTATNLLTTHLFTPPTGTRYYFRLKVEELP